MTPQQVIALLPDILRKFPAEVRAALRARVSWEVWPQPRPQDLELGRDAGLTSDSPAYFLGRGFGDESDVLEEDEGTDLAEEVDDVGGKIVLFSRNIADRSKLEEVIQHEVAHFMGADDDEIEEVDGDVTEEDEIVDDPEDEDEEG